MTKKEARRLVIEHAKRAIQRADDNDASWIVNDAKGNDRSDADKARLDDAIAWFVSGAITVRPSGNGGMTR